MIIFAVKRPVKVVGKPCAGKLHARFDEGLLGRRNIKPVTYSMIRFESRPTDLKVLL